LCPFFASLSTYKWQLFLHILSLVSISFFLFTSSTKLADNSIIFTYNITTIIFRMVSSYSQSMNKPVRLKW
jgi:hypothetical protein